MNHEHICPVDEQGLCDDCPCHATPTTPIEDSPLSEKATIHGILQEKIADVVYYESKGNEDRLLIALNHAEVALLNLFARQKARVVAEVENALDTIEKYPSEIPTREPVPKTVVKNVIESLLSKLK